MAIPFSNVTPAGGRFEIKLEPDGSDPSLFIVGGAFKAGEEILFQSPDGTPQVLDFLATTFIQPFSSSNPLRLRAQGLACTGIFPASLAPFISGDGFTGGDGSIIIDGISPFFTPSNEQKCVDWWGADSASDFDTTGNIIWLGKKGVLRLRWDGGDIAPIFNSTEQWLEMRGGGFLIETAAGAPYAFNNPARPLRSFVVAMERLLSTSTQILWGGVNRGPAGRIQVAANAYDDDSYGNVVSIYNGEYDLGALVERPDSSQYEGSGLFPLNTPFTFLAEGELNSARDVTTFGFREGSGNRLQGNVVATAVYSDALTTTQKEINIRWAATALRNRANITYSLDPDLPDGDVPPLLTEGAAPSSFTGEFPQTTITFSSIPSGWEGRAHQGSKSLKYESDITTGTFSYTPPAGEVVSYTFSKPGFLLERFDRAITQNQEIVLEPTPDPSWVEAS
ncbi:MAG: hypothetical protein AAF773_03760 [Cyanobacteria bacterium P01_D01_bin.115]